MPKMNAEITLRIATLRAAGVPIREAVDAVLGAGAVAKIAAELYTELRAKAGLS